MYSEGLGVAKDDTEAVRFYQLAAAQGLAAAQSNLGAMYAEGRGVAKNDTEAIRLYQLAAAQGGVAGQGRLGLMYAEGRGGAKNMVEAYAWLALAVENGRAHGRWLSAGQTRAFAQHLKRRRLLAGGQAQGRAKPEARPP